MGYAEDQAKQAAKEHNMDLIRPAKKIELKQNAQQEKSYLRSSRIIENVFERLFSFKRVDLALERTLPRYYA